MNVNLCPATPKPDALRVGFFFTQNRFLHSYN
jgi:hypothetical protein